MTFFYRLSVCFLLIGCSKDPYINVENPPIKEGWELIFQDEFESEFISNQIWLDNSWSRCIAGNKALEYYTNPTDSDNYQYEGGNIKLIARKENIIGRVVDHWADERIIYDGLPNKRSFSYSSGKLETEKGFIFGYYEIRCRIPNGKGLWPAFWLVSTNHEDYKEIDVFEFRCDEPNVLYMTNHFVNSNGDRAIKAKHIKGPDFSKEFHTYAVEWDSKKIVWYLDNAKIHSSRKKVPKQELRVIACLGVGGSWSGYPDNSTIFPAALEIDYIRVYQK